MQACCILKSMKERLKKHSSKEMIIYYQDAN